MPFKRRFHKKKSAGKQALTKVNRILRNVEKKRMDLDVSTTSTQAALLSAMNLVAIGDAGTQREGNVISLTSWLCNYTIRMNTSDDFCNVRVMVVLDKQCAGALPAIGDILEFTGAEKIISSPMNLDGALRFKVLYNKVHSFNLGARPNGNFSGRGNLKPRKIRYTGTSATIANVLNECLLFIHVSDETTNAPVITYQTRVRFQDL